MVTFVPFTLLSDLTTTVNLACSAGVFWAGESFLFMFVIVVTAVFDAMTEED